MLCSIVSALLVLLIYCATGEAGLSSVAASQDSRSSLRGLHQINQTYTNLEHIPESLLGDAECQLTRAAFKGTVLQSGLHHKAHSIGDCRQQCQCATPFARLAPQGSASIRGVEKLSHSRVSICGQRHLEHTL